ncbi:hypothetical protein HaLaN_02717 [Haematococcus lacustris]|uniref:Uncharacterized protein n=1 Tax=Haematococcus lacustris TaxID=44745 RepID=A0A699YET9_HAELA|nr:hypothetical protein HaLaN_02717 [Haematococcus lacustris]
MPPRKRPRAAEQEPLPIESPRKQGPTTPPGKQREERRAEWKTQRRQVIKVPGGAVLRGCKKTKRKLLAHFQLRAGGSGNAVGGRRPAMPPRKRPSAAEQEPHPIEGPRKQGSRLRAKVLNRDAGMPKQTASPHKAGWGWLSRVLGYG